MDSGPFTLTEREQEEVYQARLETNPELYPDSRTAILTGAIERALRTLGPASGPWSEVVVDRPSAPLGLLSDVQRTALNEASEHFDSVGADVYSAALDELLTRFPQPLVLAPAEPQPDAPTNIAALPDYWDERRRLQQKPDKSRCAAELRIALASSAGDKPDESYKQGFSDGFARGVEYGRRLAKLGQP